MMFIRAPIERLVDGSEVASTEGKIADITALKKIDRAVMLKEIAEDLIDGVVVLTSQGKIVYVNECAARILRQISSTSESELLPKEIQHLYKSLLETRYSFPEQHWYLKAKVFLSSYAAFTIQARWIKLTEVDSSCILLVLKDRYQTIKNIALEEAQKYGLTSREEEIWLLHRANYTYKQIAEELYITPNTVKKHMKNIHLKQRNLLPAVS